MNYLFSRKKLFRLLWTHEFFPYQAKIKNCVSDLRQFRFLYFVRNLEAFVKVSLFLNTKMLRILSFMPKVKSELCRLASSLNISQRPKTVFLRSVSTQQEYLHFAVKPEIPANNVLFNKICNFKFYIGRTSTDLELNDFC